MKLNLTELSKDQCTIMRGGAILCIIIHNFIHLSFTGFVAENESTWFQDRLEAFNQHVMTLNPMIIGDLLSYLGFYGVPVFAFITGYGLVCKYENNSNSKYTNDLKSIPFKTYLWNCLCKFWNLMIPAFLVFIILDTAMKHDRLSLLGIITQLTFTNDFIYYKGLVFPGPFWYFGFTIQLYILYYYAIYKKSNYHLILWALISFITQAIVLYYLDDYGSQDILIYVRHNAIGWLPCFLLGNWWARKRTQQNVSIPTSLLILLLSCLLFAFSIQGKYLWLASPLLAIIISIYFSIGITSCNNFISKTFLWLGKYSAFLFVTHPIMRLFSIYFMRRTESIPLKYVEIIIYVIGCCILAYFYPYFSNICYSFYKKLKK